MNNGWSRVNIGQRKFRSQTSDNMDRWKKQRWEELEKRREETRRDERRGEERRIEEKREEKRRREEDQRREDKEKRREEKGSKERRGRFAKRKKSRDAVFFRWQFWKFRCGKSARRSGAKHIWKSKW